MIGTIQLLGDPPILGVPLEVGFRPLSSVFGKRIQYPSMTLFLMQQGPGLCEEIVESEGG